MDKCEFMAACTRAGLNLQDLCNAIGMSRSAMNNKLNGRSAFTVDEAAKIARATKMEDPLAVFFANVGN